jgi:hypothetical protein
MRMAAKYANLYQLLQSDAEAKAFYDRLPIYVKDQIALRADGVNSIESLYDYADNLTRGDG